MYRNTISTALASVLIACTAIASLSSCSKDPIQEELIQFGEGIRQSPADAQADPALRVGLGEDEGYADDSDIDLAPPMKDIRSKYFDNGNNTSEGRPDGWSDPNQQEEESNKKLTI